MLATVAYDSPDASHTFSLAISREALTAAGIQSGYVLLSGNCHVDDARNTVVMEFLKSDCTDLVFLDADVSWDAEDLVTLCQHDKDIVGGVYPYRREDKQEAGDMPVRMLDGAEVENGLLEVEGLPTGFMKITRHVLERLAGVSKKFKKGADDIPIVFERTFDSDNGERWGGDLNFCRKWRTLGGQIYADYEMRLGHTATKVIYGSLAASLRRRAGLTLKSICDKIKAGTETPEDYAEAREYVGNQFTALLDVLMMSVAMARRADGPIIETGSGLTTILMAAATEHRVYCLEHHGLYAAKLQNMVVESGVCGVWLGECPIKDGWYDLSDTELPEHFALGLNDGPPRTVGSRMGFFKLGLADRCDSIICDDADDDDYLKTLGDWAENRGMDIDFVEPRAALIRRRKEAA